MVRLLFTGSIISCSLFPGFINVVFKTRSITLNPVWESSVTKDLSHDILPILTPKTLKFVGNGRLLQPNIKTMKLQTQETKVVGPTKT